MKKKNKSVIKEIYNFKEIKTAIKLLKQTALVIFDIDDVLITPSHDDNFRHPYRIKLWEKITKNATKPQIDLLESSTFAAITQVIVEPQIVKIFTDLASNKTPTIALTAMGTGRFGVISKKEDFRIKNLNKLGLSFATLTPLSGEQQAPHLENTNIILPYSICQGIPLLKSGIIFTAGVDKGIVLEYILQQYNYFPKTIIFIDDYITNIHSLKNLCIKLNIDFYGFHYKAISIRPLPTINKNLEKLRFKILEQEGKWLGYKQLQILKKTLPNTY